MGECLFGAGRYPEALSELKRAHELDPLSLIINASYGGVLAGAGRTREAIDQLHKTIDLEPDFAAAHIILSQEPWKRKENSSEERSRNMKKCESLLQRPLGLPCLPMLMPKPDGQRRREGF